MFHSRRKAVALAATGAVAALVVAGLPASAGSRDLIDRLEAAEAAKVLPPSMSLDAKGSFIVRLKAAPVASVAANKAAARDAVLKGQASAIDAAKKLGGTVGMRYADAINGFVFTGTGRAALALAKNSSIEGISPVMQYTVENADAHVHTGSAAAWDETGYTGTGVKVAIIDSGIDYYHATFGGTGKAAYDADDNTIIEPGTFPTAKVIGGYDFVGDAYDARYPDNPDNAAKPDADPRDCSVFNGVEASAGGHGSHVAGTAAGFGVNSDGTTFTGPWTAASQAGLKIGSGSAPEASLLAYRVFGCNGSTGSDIVIAAINAAVAAGAGVINMSLGSSFGRSDSSYDAAIQNAVKAGTVVVCSAGNSGPNPYITGSPGSTRAALSVAAIDGHPETDGTYIATMTDDGSKVPVQPTPSTGNPPASGTMAPVGDWNIKLTSTTQYVASVRRLGCNASDYKDADGNSLVAGKIAVVQRGSCTFSVKQANMVANGAIMGIIVNRHDQSTNFVVMSGVTNAIPMVAAAFYASKANEAAGISTQSFWGTSTGRTATFGIGKWQNPNFTYPASFTSGGPRYGDAGFKPDIAAPGVNIRSAHVGSGNDYVDYSGTSMASPHTAGAVALVRQAHPSWTAAQVKAAMVNSASRDAAKLTATTRITGNGLVQPNAAIGNGVLIYPSTIVKDGDTSLSYGVREEASASTQRQITVANLSGSSQTIAMSAMFEGAPAGATMTFNKNSITLGAGKSTLVTATLNLSSEYMAARGASSSTIKTLYGQVIATRGDGKVSTLPFNAVPASRSAVSAKRVGNDLQLKNNGGAYGSADLWELLMVDKKDTPSGVDLKSLGAQYYRESDLGVSASSDKFVLFNLSTHNMIYNPADTQWWIDIDTTGDGNADFELFMFDSGYMGGGSFNGQIGTYLYYLDAASGTWKAKSGAYTIFRPLNSSSLQVGFKTSALCDGGAADDTACAAAPSQNMSWRVTSIGAVDWNDNVDYNDTISGTVNPANPVRSWGDWADLNPGASSSFPLSTRALAAGEKRTLGWQVVLAENRAGLQSSEIYGF